MWPAIAVIVASMLAKHMANKGAQNRQESLRGAMDEYQHMKAQQNEAAINQLVDRQTPAARGTELAAVTDERARSLQSTVNAAQATEASPIAGKLSGDYAAAQERAANTVSNRTRRAIEQLSTMGAPGEQQVRSSMRFGRAAGEVDAGNRAISNVGNAYMTDIGNVRPNPFLSMAGDAGMAVGGSMLGGAPGAAAGSAASSQISPNNAEWGSLNDGPAAYDTRRTRLARGFSLWGR